MLDDALPVELPDDQLAAVIDRLRHAGGIARRSYNEQDRWDLIAFATLLWRLSWNHVDSALRDLGGKVWYEKNSLRFDLGGYTCSIYAGGHSVDWDVHSYDFTRSPKRAETVNRDQGQLFDPTTFDRDLDVDVSGLTSLIFVNCGDPQLGTAALYLGAPIAQGDVIRWAWVRRLYRADHDGADQGTTPAAFTPFGEQSQPDIIVRPREEHGTAGAGTD